MWLHQKNVTQKKSAGPFKKFWNLCKKKVNLWPDGQFASKVETVTTKLQSLKLISHSIQTSCLISCKSSSCHLWPFKARTWHLWERHGTLAVKPLGHLWLQGSVFVGWTYFVFVMVSSFYFPKLCGFRGVWQLALFCWGNMLILWGWGVNLVCNDVQCNGFHDFCAQSVSQNLKGWLYLYVQKIAFVSSDLSSVLLFIRFVTSGCHQSTGRYLAFIGKDTFKSDTFEQSTTILMLAYFSQMGCFICKVLFYYYPNCTDRWQWWWDHSVQLKSKDTWLLW